jgi:hypothetical protein
MKRFITPVILFIAFALSTVACAAIPAGEWRNVDLRGIEVLPGSCIRLWVEERAYHIQAAGDHFEGVYNNVLRTTPVGAPSFSLSCRFPPPASNPVAMQIRGWALIGRSNGSGGWRVGAEPGVAGGDFHADKTEEFHTVVTQQGNTLIDGENSGDAVHTFLFRAAAPPPAEARTALEESIRRVEGGSCLEVLTAIAVNRDDAVQACGVRERILSLSGKYISLSVDSATEFDRVPDKFLAQSTALRRQHGVLFSFTGKFEKTEVPGNAVVYEDGGKWRLGFLWF